MRNILYSPRANPACVEGACMPDANTFRAALSYVQLMPLGASATPRNPKQWSPQRPRKLQCRDFCADAARNLLTRRPGLPRWFSKSSRLTTPPCTDPEDGRSLPATSRCFSTLSRRPYICPILVRLIHYLILPHDRYHSASTEDFYTSRFLHTYALRSHRFPSSSPASLLFSRPRIANQCRLAVRLASCRHRRIHNDLQPARSAPHANFPSRSICHVKVFVRLSLSRDENAVVSSFAVPSAANLSAPRIEICPAS